MTLPNLRFPHTVPVLKGDRLYLRALTHDDIPAWFERASDRESAALAGDEVPHSIEQGQQWLARHQQRFAQQAGLRWAIVPVGEVHSVGTVGFTLGGLADRVAEIGFVVARAYWGQGIGTAAAGLAIDYGFSQLGLAQIRAEVLQRNLASRRVLQKLGFRIQQHIPASPEAGDLEDALVYVLEGPR